MIEELLRRICRSDKTTFADQETGMRSICGTRNRAAGYVLMLLLVYVLLLQGLASAYARTLMATDQFAPALVICAPSGKTDQPSTDPLEHVAQSCCNALCEAAASIGPSIKPSSRELPWLVPLLTAADFDVSPVQTAPPDRPDTLPDARAPPHLSI